VENDDWFESDQDILPPDIASFLKHVNSFLYDFEHWWKTPLAENYSTISTIKEDLHTLKQNCEHIHYIHQVRIVAWDVRDLEDANSTASLILWATMRSHKIMEDYSHQNFYEHPSISAVIACHLAANHTKPDNTLESRVRSLEEHIASTSRKVDSFESRLARLEQKNPPPKGRSQKNQGRQKDGAVPAQTP